MSRRQRRAEKSNKSETAFIQLFNSALALQQAGQFAEAEAAYRKAMAMNANIPLLYNNFGVALYSQGKHEEAVQAQKRAIQLDPANAMAHNNMGVALNAMGRHEEAIAAFSKAIELVPNNPQAINNLGDSYVKLSRFEEGEAHLRRSLALQPDYVEALTNLGASMWGQGRLDEAVALFKRVIALQPDVAMAHKNLGIVSMLMGNYAEGWREYDWRWLADKIPLRQHPKPLWRGQDLQGQSVYIWSEQGVGDEILHAGMIADIIAHGFRVVWECDRRLVPLFQRSYPAATVVPRQIPPHEATVSPEVAAHIPSGTLGNFVRNDLSKFPTRARHLAPDPVRTQAFRQRLAVKPGEKLVGMSWLSKNVHFGTSKSTPLTAWADILRTPGLRFVDLQYGDTSAERAAVKDLGIDLIHIDGLDLKDDIDGLAALIEACDLVVTVSNTTAHIAAALGKPVWILIASGIGKFWYWGFDGPTTVWYPSASLIRQAAGEDWGPSLRTLQERLADFAQA